MLMSNEDQKLQTLAGKQIDAIVAVAGVFVEQADRLFSETRTFQTAIFRNQSAWFSKVVFARSISDVIEAQTEHAKAHYDASVVEARKIAEILTDLTRSAAASASAAEPLTPSAVPVADRIERQAA
jgi:hypothetical protein